MFVAAFAVVACAMAAWSIPRRMATRGAEVARALAEELASVEQSHVKVACANEALGELDHDLRPDLRQPVKLAWIAFLTGQALMVAAWLGHQWWAVGPCLVLGFAGAAVCLRARGATVVAASLAREEMDGRVEALLGELYDAEFVLPKRREMRWKRGRRKR